MDDLALPDSRAPSPRPPEPGSKKRQPEQRILPLTDTSSTFDPLHIPDGLSNDKLGKRCEGLDPMKVDPAVLTAAGHGPKRTRALVSEFKKVMGGEIFAVEFARIKRHKHIRAYCKTCVENEAEVRRCTTFWCPFWPYRMGSNPHNPKRGKNPFAMEPV
jgi:hypothetical protein